MDKTISISSPVFKRRYKILDDMDKALDRMELDVKELEEREEEEEKDQ